MKVVAVFLLLCAPALAGLGECTEAFVKKAYDVALKECLSVATSRGDAAAQYYLGVMYGFGYGLPQADQKEAARWFRLAADQGYAAAQYYVGQDYQATHDYAEAVRWYRRAAEHGDARGEEGLGSMYQEGNGVPQDYAEAIRWYRKAAEQDGLFRDYFADYAFSITQAQEELAWMYYLGHGVRRDYVEAHMWINLAASHDDVYSATRDDFEKKMTSQQIAEAQRRAREWKPKTR